MNYTASAPATVALQRRWASWASSQELQFWSLQVIGWTSWAFASGIGWVYWEDEPDRPHVVALYAFAATVGVLASTPLRYIYRALWTRSLTLRIGTAIVLSYLMGGV